MSRLVAQICFPEIIDFFSKYVKLSIFFSKYIKKCSSPVARFFSASFIVLIFMKLTFTS